jgi:hypothetical protein
MIRRHRPRLIPLTRKLAQEHKSRDPWNGDRELKEIRRDFLRDEYNAGAFMDPDWCEIEFKGKVYRGNGHHSADMLCSLPEFPTDLMVLVRRFTVDTEQEMAAVWSRFDAAETVRKFNERVNAQIQAYKSLRDSIGRSYVQRGIGCIAYDITKCNAGAMNQRERLALIHEKNHRDFMIWFHGITTDCDFWRVPVGGAIHATWVKFPDEAADFWGRVVNSDTIDGNLQPCRALHTFIRTTHQNGGNSRANGNGAPPREMYVECIRAWNSWRNGEDWRKNYRASSPLPEPW